MSHALVRRRFPTFSAVVPVAAETNALFEQLPAALSQFVGDLQELYEVTLDPAHSSFSVHSPGFKRFPTLARKITGVIVESAGGANVHVEVCDNSFWRFTHVLLFALTLGGFGLASILPGFLVVPGIFGLLLFFSLAVMWLEGTRFISTLETAFP